MRKAGFARRFPFFLARTAGVAAGLVFPLFLLPGPARAADPAPALTKPADPPILIGPSRVTLAGGRTLEAIAVFREPGRVRVVLEDDTEIAFDPAKVVSVVALADLPEEPAPAAKPASPKPGSKTAPSTPARRTGEKTAAGAGAATGPAKVHAEPAGNGKTTSASGRTAGPSAAPADGTADDADSATAGDATEAASSDERDRDIEELAAMLQSAIANAALEGPGTGGPDESSADAQEAAAKSGKDATAAPEGAAVSATGAEDEKKFTKPRPEDFDATRPVNKAGLRFLGPKGKYPETPPQTDFPKPAAPVTSMGFGSDTWRPRSGFSSNSKWGTPLPPATSFSNRLSGLDLPITGFGPSWWAPTPTSWPSSVFPEYWRPKDGFAQAQEKKTPPPPPPTSTPPSESDK